jgi:LPXTG-motif cell wall-anchored protein
VINTAKESILTKPSYVRRVLLAMAAIFVGFVAALVTASPAAATYPVVSGEPECDEGTGTLAVVWTVRNPFPFTATVTDYEFTPASDVKLPDTIPARQRDGTNGRITATVTIPHGTETARLSVTVSFSNGEHNVTRRGEVDIPTGCTKPAEAMPDTTFVSRCDGTATLTLENKTEATKPANFEVTGPGGFAQTESIPAGQDAEITIPSSVANAVKVTEGERVWEFSWAKPANCAAPGPSLPLTGAGTAGMAGAGGVLLAAGVAALLYARRRRSIAFVAE